MDNKNEYKMGVGIVVCDRLGNFKTLVKSLENIPNKDETLFVVSDDSRHSSEDIKKILQESSLDWEHIFSGRRQVGASKNLILSRFMREGTIEHLFLLEDDVIVKDKNVFNEYIKLAEDTGVEHFSFVPTQLMEKDQYIMVKFTKDDMEISVKLDVNCNGEFNYFSRRVLDEVGLMDETYVNAYEHVDHTYRIFKHFERKGEFMGAFWYFVDHPNSNDFLASYVDEGSYIDQVETETQYGVPLNQVRAHKYFFEKHGIYVQHIPDIGVENAVLALGENITKDMPLEEKQKFMVDIEFFNKGKK